MEIIYLFNALNTRPENETQNDWKNISIRNGGKVKRSLTIATVDLSRRTRHILSEHLRKNGNIPETMFNGL
jgi:hypothetical protein